MGVLTDYFSAPDSETVAGLMEHTDGRSPLNGPRPAFDGVQAKWVDPAVVLGQLVAAIRKVPWSVDIVESTLVWPPEPDGGWEAADDGDPYMTGPWTYRLDDATRDTLAGVPDADVPALVAEWVRIEELRGAVADDWRPFVEELVALARNARESGAHLFGWACV